MLKITKPLNKLPPSRNNGSKPAFRKNNENGEVDRFGSNDIKHAKKLEKLKGQKLAKS